MDRQISVKKFFNYCFTNSHFRTKSKKNGKSECDQYTPGIRINHSDPELTAKIVKNFHLRKLISENNSTLNKKKRFANCNDSETTGIEPSSNSKQKKNKGLLSCFKKNSSKDERNSTVKKPPFVVTKLNLDTTVLSGFKEEVREEIPCPNPSQSQEPETELSRRCFHNSTIELMSRDGTLKLYSASTLTPLGSSAIQDEERIQTHLSISCFRPGNHSHHSSSDGPDDVFEASGETPTSLAFNLQKLSIEHSNRVSENSRSGVHRNKKSGSLVKEFISTDESLSLFSNEKEENIRTHHPVKSKNKINNRSNHCQYLETKNGFSSASGVKKHSFKLPRSPNCEETYQIDSYSPRTSCQKQGHTLHTSRTCTSVTSHVPCEGPPVNKWILQLYFDSLVAADQNFYSGFENLNDIVYTKEKKTKNSSPPFSYSHPNDSRTFNQTTQSRAHIPLSQSCSTTKSETKYMERYRPESECRSFKTKTHTKSKKCHDHYYSEKENKSNHTRIKTVPTTTKSRNLARCPLRNKCRNAKPAIFSQGTTYTHYPFIDGPLAKNSEKSFPIGQVDPNCESWIRTVTPVYHLM